MAKKNTLAAGAQLSSIRAAARGPVAVPKKESPTTRIIQAHYPIEVYDALHLVQGKTRRNLKQVLGEGINLLCQKYGVAEPYSEES
jgi:hypothetical protein